MKLNKYGSNREQSYTNELCGNLELQKILKTRKN